MLKARPQQGNMCLMNVKTGWMPAWFVPAPCLGQTIISPRSRDYLRGAPLAVIDGGYDFISATDAARGIILAAQKGKSGECYILQGGRITVAQVYCELARLSGKRRHLPHIPVWLARRGLRAMRWNVLKAASSLIRPVRAPYWGLNRGTPKRR